MLPKPEGEEWQQLQSQLAGEIGDLPAWQKKMESQYGLQLNDWLLLPDVNATTHLYPSVGLVQIAASDDLTDFAWRHQLSESQLKNLNQPIKTAEQLNDLRGQWVVVPVFQPEAEVSETLSPREEQLRQWMSGVWRSASQSNDASSAALGQANSMISAAATAEVESWLNQRGGHARVTLNTGLKRNENDVGLDYLHPLWSGENDRLFTQFSGHRWNERVIANLGLGWRHMINPDLMVGSNLFYDRDLTRQHNRLGTGVELWSQRVRAAANYYIPLSDWRHSDDNQFTDAEYFDLYERAARGWDINFNVGLSDHLAARAGWFQWYGDKVDVKGSRSEVSKNPWGLNLGLKWQPVPLLALQAAHEFISNQSDESKVGLNISWQFGRTLSEMLDPQRAQAMPSLMQSGNAFVERNNNIVLTYKEQKKSWHIWFDPAELTVKAASQPFIHAVKGQTAAHTRYFSSNPAVAQVDSISGRVTPLAEGKATLSASTWILMSDAPVGQASYQLTVVPSDTRPSVTDVAIEGSALIGNALTGRYRYQDNGGAAEGETRQRWYYAAAPEAQLATGESYTVTDRDIGQVLVYQVTPVNINNLQGEPAQAEIQGPSQRVESLTLEALDQGVLVGNNQVKFPAASQGRVLFTAKVVDARGQPLADRTLWWSHSNSALGNLTTNQVSTDAAGMAQVIFENIEKAGSDTVVVSLVAPDSQRTSSGPTRDINQSLAFSVEIAQPALTLKTLDNLTSVPVGSGQLALVAQLSEPDRLGIENQTLQWRSNHQSVGTSLTDKDGISQTELTIPAEFGNGQWIVEVAQAGNDPVSLTLALELLQAPPLSASPVTATIGDASRPLNVGGGISGAPKIFVSRNPAIVEVNASSGEMTFKSVGNTEIVVSQHGTATHAAPEDLSVSVTVTLAQPDALTASPVTATIGDASRPLNVGGGISGAPKIFVSRNPAIVEVNASSGEMTFKGAGNTEIVVSQQGTATHAAPEDLAVSVTVNKVVPEALSASPVEAIINDQPRPLTVSGGISGVGKIFTSKNAQVVEVNRNSGEMTFKGAGATDITVSQQETATHAAPADLQVRITVKRRVPEPLQSDPSSIVGVVETTGNPPRVSGGNGSSLYFTSTDSSIVSVTADGAMIFHQVGNATLNINQAETAVWEAPPTLRVNVSVEKATPPSLAGSGVTGVWGSTPTLQINGGIPGVAKQFTSSSANVTIDKVTGAMTLNTVGAAQVTVNQGETDIYKAPEALKLTVTVTKKASPALRVTPGSVTAQAFSNQQPLSVSGGNGGTLRFRSDKTDVATVSDTGVLNFLKSGDAKITISQDETETYFSPQPVTVNVKVTPGYKLRSVEESRLPINGFPLVRLTMGMYVTDDQNRPGVGKKVCGAGMKGGVTAEGTTDNNGYTQLVFPMFYMDDVFVASICG